MAPITISSLQYIKPRDLSAQLLAPQSSSKVAVVDVRDNDYLGGHVKGSIHAPVDQLDARMPELVRTLAGHDRVVFHCMLSQQRGPRAALAYARAKAATEATKSMDRHDDAGQDGAREGRQESLTNPSERGGGQQICVLEGGFQAWQQTFGGDPQWTEGYIRELWDAELV